MLAGYKKRFASPEQMGALRLTQLEVQPLDARFATVTGQFHLQRTKAGGGNSNGFFLLVFELTSNGWKIVRDDSTETPAQP
jgi:ketosteroid isomerase-like protein